MVEIENIPGDFSNDLKLIYKTGSGEEIYRCGNSIVARLPANRNSMTTSYVNGGYQENLQAVFNHEPKPTGGHCSHDLEVGSIEAYIKIHAGRLGLNPEKVAAMMTAAKMKNAAIATRCFRDLEVTAIVTAGIEVNGGRAGDPASWHEEDGKAIYVGGTINTIIIINSHLPAHALTRAIVTATEAKTAAIQQLMAPSRYSTGIATGSGTDQICVVSNMGSPDVITWAGKHSKLGEMIGRCVIEATTEALARQTNLTPDSQRDMLVRLDRFGIDEKKYWETASSLEGENKRDVFVKNLRDFSRNPSVVAMTSALLHIVDEIEWGLIPELAGNKTALSIMKTLPALVNVTNHPNFDRVTDERHTIIENWIRLSSWCVKNGFQRSGHD
ncbi:adenosylcobinamide amidohydrolase [hydrocarbon metagenome]|uniref:Adenosylcobinamide amidohydrolase n=1 Tax=hydrocarbon metagenome TaxID=938273 RepID=A0A0W8FIW5_9ZZZZ|nr:adenosylcobinamide amidohydrolase [Methanomicrobiaceae archaeon]